jgi:hypothetical protein
VLGTYAWEDDGGIVWLDVVLEVELPLMRHCQRLLCG